MSTATADETTACVGGAGQTEDESPPDCTPLGRLASLPKEEREAVWKAVEERWSVAVDVGQRAWWRLARRLRLKPGTEHPLKVEYQDAVLDALVDLVLRRVQTEGTAAGITPALARTAAARQCRDLDRADERRRERGKEPGGRLAPR
ncbi:MAG: hypothetical protein C0501_30645 [Isosphaera sp.]|nr:hypothetical protein [Isosphaera sp.]